MLMGNKMKILRVLSWNATSIVKLKPITLQTLEALELYVALYTTDIPSQPNDFQLAMYASDVLSASSDPENITDKLQTYTNSIARWMNDIKVNPNKTQAILFAKEEAKTRDEWKDWNSAEECPGTTKERAPEQMLKDNFPNFTHF